MRIFPVCGVKNMHFAYDIKNSKKKKRSIIKRVPQSLNIRLACCKSWSILSKQFLKL